MVDNCPCKVCNYFAKESGKYSEFFTGQYFTEEKMHFCCVSVQRTEVF